METHLLAAKIILRSLQVTINYGLLYNKGKMTELFGYTDSDYAGYPDDRVSTSGYVFIMGSVLISWS